MLSISTDVFAVNVANTTEYNNALANGDAIITVTGSGFTVTAEPGPSTANVTLEGQWSSGDPLPVLNGNGLEEQAFDSNTLTTLRNLAIENFNDGGLRAQSVLSGMSNVRFRNNDNPEDDGGGFYANNFIGNLENSQFINNRAADDGGALAVDNFTGDIVNSTFTNNAAGYVGGAI